MHEHELQGNSMLRGGLVWRGELAAVLLPAFCRCWFILVSGGLMTGLNWRFSGRAPTPLDLCNGLGAAFWLSALLFLPAWEGLAERYRLPATAATATLRQVWAMAGMVLGVVFLSFAPLGLLLAYDPSVAVAVARPLDTDRIAVTLPRLLLWLLPLVGAPLLLLGLGSLRLLRGLLGDRGGTALWLLASAGVQLPLLTGLDMAWPLTPGGIARLAFHQFAGTEPQLRDNMFGPIGNAVWLCWLAALLCLWLSQTVASRPRQRLPALQLALLAGIGALALREVALANFWLTQPARLSPDTPLALAGTFLSAALVVWLLMFCADPQTTPDPPWSLWQVLPAGALLLLGGIPLLLADQTSQPEFLAVGLAAILVLLMVILTVGMLIRRLAFPHDSAPSASRAGAVAIPRLLVVLPCLGLLFPADQGGLSPLVALTAALGTGSLTAEQQPYAVGLGLTVAAIAGMALLSSQPRRYRPRTAGRTSAVV